MLRWREFRQCETCSVLRPFDRHMRAEITAKLNEADVPVAGILSMNEVLNDNYLLKRGALQQVDNGIGGTLWLPADPTRFRTSQGVPRLPRLGEHREALLEKELGLSAADIARLEQAGAFGAADRSRPSAAH